MNYSSPLKKLQSILHSRIQCKDLSFMKDFGFANHRSLRYNSSIVESYFANSSDWHEHVVKAQAALMHFKSQFQNRLETPNLRNALLEIPKADMSSEQQR